MKIRYHEASPAEKEEILNKLKDALGKLPCIAFAYVHGSFLNEKRFRDIDVAVYLTEMPVSPLDEEMRFEAVLNEVSAGYGVDVRILNNAPASFRYNVIKSGVLIVASSALGGENGRADFIEAALRDYFDFAPFRKMYIKETLGLEI